MLERLFEEILQEEFDLWRKSTERDIWFALECAAVTVLFVSWIRRKYLSNPE